MCFVGPIRSAFGLCSPSQKLSMAQHGRMGTLWMGPMARIAARR